MKIVRLFSRNILIFIFDQIDVFSHLVILTILTVYQLCLCLFSLICIFLLLFILFNIEGSFAVFYFLSCYKSEFPYNL